MSLQDGQVYETLEALQAAVQEYLHESSAVVFAQEQSRPVWRCSGYLFQVCVADCVAVISGEQQENKQWVLNTASMSIHGTEGQQDELYVCYAEDEDEEIDDEITDEKPETALYCSQVAGDSEATLQPSQYTATQQLEEDSQYRIEEDEEEEPIHAFHGGRGRLSFLPVSSSRTSPNPRLSPTTSLLPFPQVSHASETCSSAQSATSVKHAVIECPTTERTANNADGLAPPIDGEIFESMGVFEERAASMGAGTAFRQSTQEAVARDEYIHDDEDMPLTSNISSLETAYTRQENAASVIACDLEWAVKQDHSRSDTQGAVAPSSIFPSRTDWTLRKDVQHAGTDSTAHATRRKDSISESASSTPSLAMTSRTASVSSSVGGTTQPAALSVQGAAALDATYQLGSAPAGQQPLHYVASISESDSAALLAALDGCTDSVPSSGLASAARFTSSSSLPAEQEQTALRDTEVDAAAEAETTSHLFERYTWNSPESKASSSRVARDDSPEPSTLSKVSLSITAWDNLHQETTAGSAVDMYEQYMEQPAKRQAPHHSAETIHQTGASISNFPEIFDFSTGVIADGVAARVAAHRKGDILDVSDSSSDSSTPRPSTMHKSCRSQMDVAGAATVPAGSVRPIDMLLKPDQHNRAILARQLDVDASDSELSALSDNDDASCDTDHQQPQETGQLSQSRSRNKTPIVKPISAPLAKLRRTSTSLSPSRASGTSRATSKQPKGIKREMTPSLPQVESKSTATRSRKRKAASQRTAPSKAPRLMNASIDIESAIVGAGFVYTDDCRGEDRPYAKREDEEEERPESDDDDCIMVVASRVRVLHTVPAYGC